MPAPLDWAEVESSPWFNALTPSQKSATHLEWRDTVLSEQEDLDDDTKVKLLALSESRAKALAGQPQDADPLKSYYAEREKKNSEISQGYEAFTQGEFADDPEFSALDETFKGRRDAAMVRGSLFVNPSLVLDKDKYEAAVRASDAPVSEKVLALTQFKDRNEQASQNLANTLSYTDEDFRKFASDGYNQGKTNSQVVSEWKAQQKLPDGIFGSILGAGRQAKLGFSGGLSGLERAVGGIGMALGVGGEQYAAESGQEAASYAARREIAGGAPIIGEVAEGATSLIPTLAVGAVGAALSPTPAAPAAVPLTLAAGAAARATISRALTSLAAGAVTGGLQSAGSTVADAFEMYKLRGDTDADAIGQARVDGAVSGITTGAVTGLFGALGTKLGAGGGIETLFRRNGAEVLAVAGEQAVKNAFVTSAKSILGNATEEAIEEGTDQLLQGLYEAATRSPDKDFRSILEETVHAAKIGGILGGGMQTIKEGLTFKSMVDTAKTDPALGDPVRDAAVAQGLVDEKEFEQDANEALEATVNENLGLSEAKRAALIAKRAADQLRTIGTAPATTAVLDTVVGDADNLVKLNADAIRAEVVDALSRPTPPSGEQMVQGAASSLTISDGAGQTLAGLPDAATMAANAAQQLQAIAPATAAVIEQQPLPTQIPSAPAEAEPTTESLPVTDETLTSGDVGIPPVAVAKAKPKAQTPWKVLSTKGKVKRLKDTDNPELESILYAIIRGGGIGRYSAEQKKAQKAEGKFYGDTDSLDTGRLNAFWDKELFNVGSKSTLDTVAQDLHEQGYFPGMAADEVTPQMLLDRIEEAIAVYEQANRNNGLTDAEARDEENENLGETQALAFEEAAKEGAGKTKVSVSSLEVGDKMMVDGEEVTVSGLKYDEDGYTTSVQLRSGTRFGAQSVYVGDNNDNALFVDEITRAPQEPMSDFLDGQEEEVPPAQKERKVSAWRGTGKPPSGAASAGLGFFTTESKEYAQQYADGEAGLKQVTVSFQNPYEMPREEFREIDRGYSEETAKEVAARLKKEGYDGIIINQPGGVMEYITFSLDQIVEAVPAPAEGELFAAEPTKSTRPKNKGETKKEQVAQEDLLGGLKEAKAKGEAERAQTKIDLEPKAEKPAAKPTEKVPKGKLPVPEYQVTLEDNGTVAWQSRKTDEVGGGIYDRLYPDLAGLEDDLADKFGRVFASKVSKELRSSGKSSNRTKPVKADEPTPVQDSPVEEVPAAPAAEPSAQDQGGEVVAPTEEVAPPAATKAQQAKAERAKRKAALAADLAADIEKLQGEIGLRTFNSPSLDPRAFATLLGIATKVTKIGVITFEDFAATIKDLMPQLWNQIKDALNGVWAMMAARDSNLEELPSRAEVSRILEALEAEEDAGVEVVPADTTTEEVAADEGKVEPVDTGKTTSEETAAAEGAADTFVPPSEGQGPPKEADLLQNVGFGKFRNESVRSATLQDPQFMFERLFSDTEMDQTLAGKNAQRLRDVRDIVKRMQGYKEYQDAYKLTPAQIREENAKVAAELTQTLEDLRGNGIDVDVQPSGVVRIRLTPEQKTKYEDLISSNSIQWSNQFAAHVSGRSSTIINFGRDVSDRDAGRPVAYERAAEQTEARVTADRIRAELAQADDESILDSKEVNTFVNQATRKKLYAGVDMGIPLEIYNEQVYDAALIGKAHKDKKPMFLLASQPGSGKTFVIGASIERMKKQGAKKIVYVTRNQELIGQIKKDLNAYDIDGVEFMTYAALDDAVKNPAEDTDAIIFDEAHEVRYSVSGDASKRAIKAGEWMNKSKFTVLASATPYEDLEQMRYLWAAGAFQPFAREDLRGDAEKGWYGFAEVLGGEVRLKDGEPTGVKFPEDTAKLREMRFASREYLRKRGMFSQRKLRIPAEMIRSFFPAVAAKPEWVTMFDATVEALAGVKGANNNLKAFVTNLQKRILEASKQEAAVKLARQKVAAGKRTVIFVETRSENERDLPEIVAAYQGWVESGRDPETKPEIVPDIPNIDKFFEKLIELGIDEIKFPSAQDYFKETLGDLGVVFYTGNESGKQGETSLSKWNSGEAPVMVATMARGGTGLSLHDKLGVANGGAERAQIMLNLPWRASEVEQVAGRTARYGMKSVTEIYWLFTPDIEFDRKLAQKVGNRMASMNVLVQGDITPSATIVTNYDLQTAEDIDKNTEDRDQVGDELTSEQAAAMAELNTSEMSIVYTEEDNSYLKMVEDNKITQKTSMSAWEVKPTNRLAIAGMRSMLANAGVPNDAPLVVWDEDGKVIPPSLRGQAEPADIRQSAAPSLSPVYGLVKRTLTTKDKLQVKEALRILRKAIPQIDSLVTVDSRENLLKRDDLTEDEKAAIRGPNFAQGIYSNGRVFVAFNNVIRTDKHASEAAAIAGTIVHELMHKGAAIMRLSPDLAPVYASWKSMLDAHVTDGDLNVLVRSGYPGYANWRNNSAIREKAQEEVFVKRIESLFHKGDLLTDAEKTLMQRFLSFIRSLVNRLLGKEMSMGDEVVQRWGRFFVVATANRHISLDGSGGLMTSMGRSPQAIRHAELEAKFNAGTITPEETAEAEKLVEERARSDGYELFFHGTDKPWTVADMGRKPTTIGSLMTQIATGKVPVFASSKPAVAGGYGSKVMPLFIKTQGAAVIDGGGKRWGHSQAELNKALKANPVVIVRNTNDNIGDESQELSDVVSVADPTSIKSADPFTGVDLDQRFDITSPDIRYSMAPGESPRDGADEPRPASLFSTYLTPEEAAAVKAAAARMDAAKAGGDDPLAKFAREQVLGQAGVGMVYKQQQLGPQQAFAMDYIGFTEDGSGLPVVNHAATKKAKSIALDLLNPNSFFAMRYQEEAGNYDAAAAVLQLELTRYAIAMLAKGDASLLSTVRRNWNNIIMGKYLTMASAGRLLQARSHYTGTVATTLDEMTAAQNTAALKFLKEQKAKDPIRTLEDYNNAVANALPDYSAMWDALGKGKGIPDPKGIPDLNWLEKAMGALDSNTMQMFGRVMGKMGKLSRLVDARSKMKDDDIRRSIPDWGAAPEGEELPTDPDELDRLIAQTREEIASDLESLLGAMGEKPLPPEVKKVLEDNAPKMKRKPVAAKPPMDKDAPGVIPPEKQKEINDTIAEVDSLEQEGDTKSTEAATAKLTQLLADLAKVPSPTVPSDSIIAKIRRIVAKHIRNGENVAYSDFYDSMTEDFEGLANEVGESIREDIQEMLIQATWQTFDQAANKTAQDMLAKMKSIKDITYGKPDQARQVKKEVRAAIVNRGGLTEIPLKKRLTDALIALNVEDDVAAELAEEAYGQSVRYAAKRLALRTAKITESMAAGGNKRMLAAMAKASPDMVSDPTWQHNAVRSVFEASGFSFEEAEVAATNAASRFDDIFTNSGISVERNAKKRMDDAVVRLIDKYAALQSDTPSLKKAAEIRKRNIQDLFRQQVRVPIDFDDVGGAAGFETLAMAMGATRRQAMTLFHEAKTETRYNKQRGTDRLILTKLIEFIKTKTSAELNEPGLRDTMVEEFLKSNGFTPEQIREIKPNILNNLEKYLGEARSAAITRILKQNAAYKKALETKDTSFMTEAEKQLKKTLENIRLGIADTTSSVAEVLAGSLKEPVKFLKTDMVTLAQLDSRITAAQNDGRTHDAAIAIKELYELLARRRQSTGFLERLGIAYNNSALSGIATLGINLYGPVGSMMTRVSVDLLRAVKNKDWNAISLVFNSLADTFSNAYAEGALAIRGDAYTNAMQRVILKVNNLRQGAIAATEVLKDKTAKPWDRVKALGVVVQSYTDITRRILSTADQTWFSTMQGYFYKLQASKALINTKMPLPMVQKAVFDITEKTALKIKNDKAMIDTYASRVEALRGKPEEEFRAGINAIVRDTSYLDDDSISLADEVREYRTTMDNELRSIIRAAALPYKKRPDLAVDKVLKELKLQKLAVDLRQRDLVVKDIDDLLKGRFGEAEAKRIKKFAEKESEYEIGNHKGEAGSQLDIFNQFSLLIQNAGYSVIQKNPILGRMLLGYFGVPVNLLNRSLWYTPYGLLRYAAAKRMEGVGLPNGEFYRQSMETAEQMKQRFSEAILGTSVFAFVLALQALGDDDEEELFNVTLAGPTNKTEYDAWVKNGHRKGAIEMNLDGKVYSVNWARGLFEPWKPAFVAMGAYDDMKLNRKLGDRENEVAVINYLAAAMSGWNQQASFFGAKSTIGSTFSANPDTNMLGTLAYKASPLIPFSGLLNSISKFYTGPNTYRGREGAIWANIPVVSMFATNRAVNALGDPVGVTGNPIEVANDRAWYAGMPLNVGGKLTGNDAKVYEFILERGTGPGIPQRSAIETKNGFITDAEFLDYVSYRGRIVKSKMLRELPKLRAMDDESLSKAVGEISSDATSDAKKRFRYK